MKPIKVMTLNIRAGMGTDKKKKHHFKPHTEEEVHHNLDQIVELIKRHDIDVACLQEVDFKCTRTSRVNQAEYLAEKLGYHQASEVNLSMPFHIFGWGISIGNTVLSRYPIKESTNHNFFLRIPFISKLFLPFLYDQYEDYVGCRIPILPKIAKILTGEHRGYQHAVIDYNGQLLSIINTHLESFNPLARRRQAKTLCDYLRKLNGPWILAGDFNGVPPHAKLKKGFIKLDEYGDNDDYTEDTTIEVLTADGQFSFAPDAFRDDNDHHTYPAWKPNRRIDYIFADMPAVFKRCRVLGEKVSDHLGVLAEIVFPRSHYLNTATEE